MELNEWKLSHSEAKSLGFAGIKVQFPVQKIEKIHWKSRNTAHVGSIRDGITTALVWVQCNQTNQEISKSFVRHTRHWASYGTRALGPRFQKLTLWNGDNITIERRDFHVRNRRNYSLECTLYIPFTTDAKAKKAAAQKVASKDKEVRKDVILYCHGASGGRLDGLTDAWEIAMQHRIALCTFDFSGCGLSQGDTVTLGFFEEDDIRTVIRALATSFKYSHITLWGRSMGAVAAVRLMSHGTEIPPPPFFSPPSYKKWSAEELLELLEDLGGKAEEFYNLYHDEDAMLEPVSLSKDQRIALIQKVELLSSRKRFAEAAKLEQKKAALERKLKQGEGEVRETSYMNAVKCMILDSPYGDLWKVSQHLVEHYKTMLPAFILRGVANTGLPMLRKAVLNRIPEFDIKKMAILENAKRCRIPCIILHGKQDNLIPWKQSEHLFQAYGNPGLIIEENKKEEEEEAEKSDKRFQSSGGGTTKDDKKQQKLDNNANIGQKKKRANQKFMRVSCGRLLFKAPKRRPSSVAVAVAGGEGGGGGGAKGMIDTTSRNGGVEGEGAGRSSSSGLSSSSSVVEEEEKQQEDIDHTRLRQVEEKEEKDDDKSLKLQHSRNSNDGLSSSSSSSTQRYEAQELSPIGIPRTLILVDGDHNSLRPIRYYDSLSDFIWRRFYKKSPPVDNNLPNCPLNVVPAYLKKSTLRFYYGVAMISEFTEQKVTINKLFQAPLSSPESTASSSSSSPEGGNIESKTIVGQGGEKEKKSRPNDEKKERAKKRKYGSGGSGVSCSVRTVSVSWRVVLGLHPRKGLLIMRPYSGGTLYSVRYTELLSCEVVDPVQLEFVFLDSHQIQRRVRFYNTRVLGLKDHIDRCMRRLTTTTSMSDAQVARAISANLASACATLVDKHLLLHRGLTTERVRSIADSLIETIESMMKERDKAGKAVNTTQRTRLLVDRAVVKAVQERTGWRPDIESLAKAKAEKAKEMLAQREAANCVIS
eukprot:jgi/Bigna1/87133/estExt_fgenesh1_pg.C_170040